MPSLPPLTPEYLPSLASFTRRCAQALAARIERPAAIVWADCLAFDRAARQPLAALDKAQLQRALNRYRGAFLGMASRPPGRWLVGTACTPAS